MKNAAFKTLTASAVLLGLVAGAASAGTNAQTQAAAAKELAKYGYTDVSVASLSDSQQIALASLYRTPQNNRNDLNGAFAVEQILN